MAAWEGCELAEGADSTVPYQQGGLGELVGGIHDDEENGEEEDEAEQRDPQQRVVDVTSRQIVGVEAFAFSQRYMIQRQEHTN